jgi:peptidoglycan/LPS O-acetylase OafA/YrhL
MTGTECDLARLRRLTPFRFVAAMLVVLFHFGSAVLANDAPWLRAVSSDGTIAVSFFFCLSGFVMACVYRTPMGAQDRSAYWASRLARIYPLYFFGILSVLPIVPWTGADLALSVLLLQSWLPGHALSVNSPGWSLSVEALFYALFPWLAGAILRTRLGTWTAVAGLLWALTQVLTAWLTTSFQVVFGDPLYPLIFYFPPMHLNEFLIGVVAGRAAPLLGKSMPILAAACAMAAALVLGLQRALGVAGWVLPGSNGLYAPLFAAFFCVVVSLPRLSWLERRWPVALGEASYAVYILQLPVMYGLAEYLRQTLQLSASATFYLGLVLLVALSLASHLYFEQPLRQWLKLRWRSRMFA